MLFPCYSAIRNPRLLPLWQRDGIEEKLNRIHPAQTAVVYPAVTDFSSKEITKFQLRKQDVPRIITISAVFGHQLSRSGKDYLGDLPVFPPSTFRGSVSHSHVTPSLGTSCSLYCTKSHLATSVQNYSFFLNVALNLRFTPKKPAHAA